VFRRKTNKGRLVSALHYSSTATVTVTKPLAVSGGRSKEGDSRLSGKRPFFSIPRTQRGLANWYDGHHATPLDPGANSTTANDLVRLDDLLPEAGAAFEFIEVALARLLRGDETR
jgi:hypothetical protein